jgi:OFA family oxalate/formate antiporter-like MFS transporter
LKPSAFAGAPTPRWHIVLAGFLLALMGGMSYAWGVLVLPLMARFGWSKAEAALPFTVFLVVFALAMVPAGRLQDRLGPRVVATAGALLYFVAYAGAALIGQVHSVWWLVASYGVAGGAACALTYACIAPPARKWFPDKPALAVSTAVMGFGLAALVLAPFKSEYLIVVHGIEGTFLVIGAATLVVDLLAARLLANPPEGWSPPGASPTATAGPALDLAPSQMARTARFWIIWLAFAAVISGGLVAIGLIPAYGRTIGLDSAQAALAISVFAAFNGFGRPLGGLLADRHGVLPVMLATYAVQAAVLLGFAQYAQTLPALYAAAALLGWSFAVTLGLFPVLTSSCFGVRHLGANYGLVFTAFGAGALVPLWASWLHDRSGSYGPAFFAAGVLAVLGLVSCIVLRGMLRGGARSERPAPSNGRRAARPSSDLRP